jgi:hypothetical protein
MKGSGVRVPASALASASSGLQARASGGSPRRTGWQEPRPIWKVGAASAESAVGECGTSAPLAVPDREHVMVDRPGRESRVGCREPLRCEDAAVPCVLSAEGERLQQPYQACRYAQSTASRCELAATKGYEPEAEAERNRWVGLMPGPRIEHAAGVRGSRALYPAWAAEQLVAVTRLHRSTHRLGDLSVALWWEGHWVEPLALRKALAAPLERMSREAEKARAGGRTPMSQPMLSWLR